MNILNILIGLFSLFIIFKVCKIIKNIYYKIIYHINISHRAKDIDLAELKHRYIGYNRLNIPHIDGDEKLDVILKDNKEDIKNNYDFYYNPSQYIEISGFPNIWLGDKLTLSWITTTNLYDTKYVVKEIIKYEVNPYTHKIYKTEIKFTEEKIKQLDSLIKQCSHRNNKYVDDFKLHDLKDIIYNKSEIKIGDNIYVNFIKDETNDKFNSKDEPFKLEYEYLGCEKDVDSGVYHFLFKDLHIEKLKATPVDSWINYNIKDDLHNGFCSSVLVLQSLHRNKKTQIISIKRVKKHLFKYNNLYISNIK